MSPSFTRLKSIVMKQIILNIPDSLNLKSFDVNNDGRFKIIRRRESSIIKIYYHIGLEH